MALIFLETPRFDAGISFGSAGGPGFNTTIFTGHGGAEQRGINWAQARGKWDVTQGIRDAADMDTIRQFFFAMRGRATGFRYKDWLDFQITNEPVQGTVNSSNNSFKLIRTYGAGALTYVRRLFKPVSGTFTIFNNGVSVPIGGGASQVAIDYTTGILTFGASSIPATGHVITATGEFDCAVRFDTDELKASNDDFATQSWSQIPIVELPLVDA